jgi:hypothetical protein
MIPFNNFQSYPNTYCTKLKGSPPKLPLWHQKMDTLVCQDPTIEVFGEYMDKFLKVFVDGLNIHNLNWEEHLKHLWYVLMKSREINLKLNPNKCEFAKSKLAFLCHKVNQERTQPNQRKIKTVTNFPIPTTVTNVWAFLGLTWHYRNYVKGHLCIAIPLFELTKKD